MKRAVLLVPIVCAFFAFSVFGQREKSEKDEIPADLFIKLSSVSRNRPAGPSYSITINGDGTWVYEGFRGFHVGRFTAAELTKAHEERLKNLGKSGWKMPIERLSESDLREIVADFAAMKFFNLDAKYSSGQVNPESGEVMLCITHAEEEVIFISYGGREKSVENFTGCFSETSKKLTALAEKILSKLNLR